MPEMSQWSHVTGGVDLSSMVCNVTVGQWDSMGRAAQLSTATCGEEEQPAPRCGPGNGTSTLLYTESFDCYFLLLSAVLLWSTFLLCLSLCKTLIPRFHFRFMMEAVRREVEQRAVSSGMGPPSTHPELLYKKHEALGVRAATQLGRHAQAVTAV